MTPDSKKFTKFSDTTRRVKNKREKKESRESQTLLFPTLTNTHNKQRHPSGGNGKMVMVKVMPDKRNTSSGVGKFAAIRKRHKGMTAKDTKSRSDFRMCCSIGFLSRPDIGNENS